MIDFEPPQRLKEVDLYAWLGEDEYGSGVVGLKQGLVPAGYIPLVATSESKVNRANIIQGMSLQALSYQKRIYLCRYKFDGILWHTNEGIPPNDE